MQKWLEYFNILRRMEWKVKREIRKGEKEDEELDITKEEIKRAGR